MDLNARKEKELSINNENIEPDITSYNRNEIIPTAQNSNTIIRKSEAITDSVTDKTGDTKFGVKASNIFLAEPSGGKTECFISPLLSNKKNVIDGYNDEMDFKRNVFSNPYTGGVKCIDKGNENNELSFKGPEKTGTALRNEIPSKNLEIMSNNESELATSQNSGIQRQKENFSRTREELSTAQEIYSSNENETMRELHERISNQNFDLNINGYLSSNFLSDIEKQTVDNFLPARENDLGNEVVESAGDPKRNPEIDDDNDISGEFSKLNIQSEDTPSTTSNENTPQLDSNGKFHGYKINGVFHNEDVLTEPKKIAIWDKAFTSSNSQSENSPEIKSSVSTDTDQKINPNCSKRNASNNGVEQYGVAEVSQKTSLTLDVKELSENSSSSLFLMKGGEKHTAHARDANNESSENLPRFESTRNPTRNEIEDDDTICIASCGNFEINKLKNNEREPKLRTEDLCQRTDIRTDKFDEIKAKAEETWTTTPEINEHKPPGNITTPADHYASTRRSIILRGRRRRKKVSKTRDGDKKEANLILGELQKLESELSRIEAQSSILRTSEQGTPISKQENFTKDTCSNEPKPPGNITKTPADHYAPHPTRIILKARRRFMKVSKTREGDKKEEVGLILGKLQESENVSRIKTESSILRTSEQGTPISKLENFTKDTWENFRNNIPENFANCAAWKIFENKNKQDGTTNECVPSGETSTSQVHNETPLNNLSLNGMARIKSRNAESMNTSVQNDNANVVLSTRDMDRKDLPKSLANTPVVSILSPNKSEESASQVTNSVSQNEADTNVSIFKSSQENSSTYRESRQMNGDLISTTKTRSQAFSPPVMNEMQKNTSKEEICQGQIAESSEKAKSNRKDQIRGERVNSSDSCDDGQRESYKDVSAVRNVNAIWASTASSSDSNRETYISLNERKILMVGSSQMCNDSETYVTKLKSSVSTESDQKINPNSSKQKASNNDVEQYGVADESQKTSLIRNVKELSENSPSSLLLMKGGEKHTAHARDTNNESSENLPCFESTRNSTRNEMKQDETICIASCGNFEINELKYNERKPKLQTEDLCQRTDIKTDTFEEIKAKAEEIWTTTPEINEHEPPGNITTKKEEICQEQTAENCEKGESNRKDQTKGERVNSSNSCDDGQGESYKNLSAVRNVNSNCNRAARAERRKSERCGRQASYVSSCETLSTSQESTFLETVDKRNGHSENARTVSCNEFSEGTTFEQERGTKSEDIKKWICSISSLEKSSTLSERPPTGSSEDTTFHFHPSTSASYSGTSANAKPYSDISVSEEEQSKYNEEDVSSGLENNSTNASSREEKEEIENDGRSATRVGLISEITERAFWGPLNNVYNILLTKLRGWCSVFNPLGPPLKILNESPLFPYLFGERALSTTSERSYLAGESDRLNCHLKCDNLDIRFQDSHPNFTFRFVKESEDQPHPAVPKNRELTDTLARSDGTDEISLPAESPPLRNGQSMKIDEMPKLSSPRRGREDMRLSEDEKAATTASTTTGNGSRIKPDANVRALVPESKGCEKLNDLIFESEAMKINYNSYSDSQSISISYRRHRNASQLTFKSREMKVYLKTSKSSAETDFE